MSIVKRYFLVISAIFFFASASGQATRSPYSAFGIGEPYGSATINTQGMAGVGASQPQYWFMNNQNPALLVYNTLTVFQAGLLGERRTISGNGISETGSAGNMSYLATAFPIKPGKWSSAVGLMPYSSVNFNLNYQGDINNSDQKVNILEEGRGGITQLYWSNGVRLNREMAIGLKASYLFSSIVNKYINQVSDTTLPIQYFAAVEEKILVKDFMLGAGFSFSKDSLFSQKKYRVSFGATYDFPADLNTKKRDLIYRTNSLGDTINVQTLESSDGTLYLPPGITVGASLSRGQKWSIGTEFRYQDWSKFKSINQDDENLDQSWRIALGGEITPDQFAVENYFKRITYRMGVSYEKTPSLTQSSSEPASPLFKDVKDIGINLGFSLPAGRSSLDFAFRYGKRGSKQDNIIEETYFKVYFGLTFNDQWFIKRKFD